MNISALISLVQESKCAARLKPKEYSEPQQWSWVIEPVPNYIESGGGPWPSSEVEWLELNPIKTEHVGRLVAPKKINKTSWLKVELAKAIIPYTLSNGIFRVTF
ncbi:MAG: DUF6678 family protein [Janthinobacterium lividum]